ncbi:MAG: hypothetical protein Q8O67_26385 [Deltaproteobacteria bacterium]|nr:hypothetical protein [Deltaproteobacteria bacterium]
MPVRNDPTPKTAPKTTTTTTTAPIEPRPAAAIDDDAEDIGKLNAAPEKHLSAIDLDRARGELRRSFAPQHMTEKEAFAVVGKLAGLPAADFKSVVGDMARGPELEKLVAALSPADKQTFMSLLANKGMVGVEPSASPPASRSPRAPTAPTSPAILRDDPKLPPAMREVILKQNIESVQTYNKDYSAYREDYQEAVKSTKSIGELRAIGPMVAPQTPEHAPGLAYNDPNNIKYEAARGPNVMDPETTGIVADQARVLSGRPVAGMSFTLEGKAMLTVGNMVGVGYEGSIKRTADGRTETKGNLAAQVKPGPLTVKATEEQVTVAAERGDVKVKAIAGKKGVGAEVLVDGNGGSLTISDKAGLRGTATSGGVTIKGGFNGDSMEFGVSKEFKLKNDYVELKVEGGGSAGLQGVTEADADAFVSTGEVGFFDAPPELARGKSWKALPAETRADYERQGWTEKEWSSAVDLESVKRRKS